jgi:hypothetical protein
MPHQTGFYLILPHRDRARVAPSLVGLIRGLTYLHVRLTEPKSNPNRSFSPNLYFYFRPNSMCHNKPGPKKSQCSV